MSNTKTELKGLQFSDYAHEKDVKAMKTLQKSPMVKKLMGAMSDLRYKLIVEMTTAGNGLHVDEKAAPEIYALAEKACRILDYDQMPDLYIQRMYRLDMGIIGYEKPVIIIPKMMLDMDEDILLFELGSAISKFKSGYLPFFNAAKLINSGFTALLPGAVSAVVMADFRSWSRKAELSADRAGLLTCQNYEAAMKFMMMKCGLPKSAPDNIDINEYINEYIETVNNELKEASMWVRTGRFGQNFASTEGLKNDRILELFNWYQIGNYYNIIEKYA